MRNMIAATALAGALLVTGVSAAAAGDDGYYYERDHRGPGPVLGFFGQVLTGALTIATAPLALIPGARHDGWRDSGHGRDYAEGAYAPTPEIAQEYYGAGARFYGPPPRYVHDGERW